MTPREARIEALRIAANLAMAARFDVDAPHVFSRETIRGELAKIARDLRQQAIDLEDAAGEKVVRRRDRVIPLCDRCGHKATMHSVDDEELRECLAWSCACEQFEAPPTGPLCPSCGLPASVPARACSSPAFHGIRAP